METLSRISRPSLLRLWSGQRFESLEAAQAHLDHWEERWADQRIHGSTKRQVAAMFAEEKPALMPLPLEPFRYYQYGERTVHLDGCVEVEAAYYSAPPGWIGRMVRVQWDGLHVRLLDPQTGMLLREHLRQQRGRYRIKDEDRAKRTPLGTMQLLARATQAGPHIGQFAKALFELQAEAAIRAFFRSGHCRRLHGNRTKEGLYPTVGLPPETTKSRKRPRHSESGRCLQWQVLHRGWRGAI